MALKNHVCLWLSSCCDAELKQGEELDYDMDGVTGVCGHCGDRSYFNDDGHTPWDDDPNFILKKPVPEHDCEFWSGCCSASPLWELDEYLTGHCGRCGDGAGFLCSVEEDCPNNTENLLRAGSPVYRNK